METPGSGGTEPNEGEVPENYNENQADPTQPNENSDGGTEGTNSSSSGSDVSQTTFPLIFPGFIRHSNTE